MNGIEETMHKINESMKRQLENTARRGRPADRAMIADYIDHFGFTREKAGEDFDRAVEALAMTVETGRGLLVAGAPGCGKTTLLKAIQLIRRTEIGYWVPMNDPRRYEIFRNNLAFYRRHNVFIDDLGSRDATREYGNIVSPEADFIEAFYEDWQQTGCRLYASTNCTSKQLGSDGKLGIRAMDRLLEMSVVVKFTGASHREKMVVG